MYYGDFFALVGDMIWIEVYSRKENSIHSTENSITHWLLWMCLTRSLVMEVPKLISGIRVDSLFYIAEPSLVL
jgi:hypothetical protein